MDKIISKKDIAKIEALKKNGKKVVLCHGVFDLVHPGHIIHFQEAKKLGDILIVSITAAKYVRKGPGRPYFNDEMRLKFLSSIECIDYVMLSEGYTVDDIIKCVKPDFYVKGQEYAKAEEDITGKITEEVELVKKHGGDIYYTTGQVFSSTKLINSALPTLPDDVKDYMKHLCQLYSMEDIKIYADKIKNLKVLVIGDVIIDKYTYCHVQGLMSKDMGYSARYKKEEEHLGGSLAVARHLSTFSEHLTLASIIGNETDIHSRLLNSLSDKMHLDLEFSPIYPTIVKQRYITVNEKREELHKVFGVNNIPNPVIIDSETMERFHNRIHNKISEYDIVILCDFGHGLIDKNLLETIQNKAKFLAVNCQTNSSNYGLNIITKYHRADAFALDQKELKLAYPAYEITESEALKALSKHLHGIGWLTRGAKGSYDIKEGIVSECPAFTLKVKDTIGAGDAFFAIASLFAVVEAPIEICTFMGNIAGALAANIVGNKYSLDKIDILKYASTLLNM